MEQKKKHRFRWYLPALGIFFLLMLLTTACVMHWLWGYLEQYEANTPTAAIERYLSLLRAEEYDRIYQESGFQETEFCAKQEYTAYLKALYTGGLAEATVTRRSGGEADTQLYSVRLKGEAEPAAVLELQKQPEGAPYQWKARTQAQISGSITIEAPTHVTVTVNGRALDQTHIIEENIEIEQYQGVHDRDRVPEKVRYRAEGFLLPPEVQAWHADGTLCQVSEIEEGVFLVTAPLLEGAQEKAELLERVAKTYAEFISRDAASSQFFQYVDQNTDFYNAVWDFYNGWYMAHEAFEYRNLAITGLQEFSPNDFTGEISFDYVIRAWGQEYVYPSHYVLSFLKENDAWRLVDLRTK